MSEWQPIETAPRDGTKFWASVGADAVAVFWHDGFGEFVSEFRRMTLAPGLTFEDGATFRDHHPTIYRPTHWMPLPDPPVSTGAG